MHVTTLRSNGRCVVCGYHTAAWPNDEDTIETDEGAFHTDCFQMYQEEKKHNRVLEAII